MVLLIVAEAILPGYVTFSKPVSALTGQRVLGISRTVRGQDCGRSGSVPADISAKLPLIDILSPRDITCSEKETSQTEIS